MSAASAMTGLDWLEAFANGASIVTAFVALVAAGYVWFDLRRKRQKLERYLKEVKQSATGSDKGQRTLLHLIAKLGMTEAELLQASFRSKKVQRRLAKDDETGRASAMLLEYVEASQ